MEDDVTFLIALAVTYAAACGVAGSEPGAPLWLRWPLPIWDWIAHDWRHPQAVAAKPDYARIAALEYELFGIEPKPGTAAAALVSAGHAAKALRSAGAAVHNEP